jgi:hypothetical protein
MGQVAQMRIAQGKLSQGFAMQAQNMGPALSILSGVPFVGGPLASALHARDVERRGLNVDLAVAGLLEGSYGRQRGISDTLSMGVAGGALEQKYRYNPEMLDYQMKLLGLMSNESNIKDMGKIVAERKKHLADVTAEESHWEPVAFTERGLVFGENVVRAAGNEKIDAARALLKQASGQFGPQIASQGKQVEALKAQAYESYKQNFYGGMGTTSFADWRSSGVSSATMGGPGADILVSGVELTNTLLAQIVDNTKGFNKKAGVRE